MLKNDLGFVSYNFQIMARQILVILSLVLCCYSNIYAQDAKRFEKEISNYLKEDASGIPANPILFVGSSTIRMWKDLEVYFPNKNIINRGFGGSQMSDLLYYANDLILKYKPVKVFIYEGDNDLAAGEKPKKIQKETKKLVNQIWKNLPETEIVLISAKPSLARWGLKDKYIELNQLFEKYCADNARVTFASTWSIMLKDGIVRDDIFIEDGLHMNKTGYDLWAEVIGKFL
ncbi:MAG: SGNH/GDSL hydrolase family protein [Bacteroidetes bacterium]|nr:SGNH/GDSL hydrolase family protein [Bacteroidota bacterium]